MRPKPECGWWVVERGKETGREWNTRGQLVSGVCKCGRDLELSATEEAKCLEQCGSTKPRHVFPAGCPWMRPQPGGICDRRGMAALHWGPSSLLKSNELPFAIKKTVLVIPMFWFIVIKRKKKKTKLQNTAALPSCPPPQNGTSLETMKLRPSIQVFREESLRNSRTLEGIFQTVLRGI